MTEPLAYLLTWTTYGSWLPGDRRGWVDKHDCGAKTPYQKPDGRREVMAKARMSESAVWLSPEARDAVDAAIRETCNYRTWPVHALNVRSNHAHVVVTAQGATPEWVMKVLKSYGTRAMNRMYPQADRKHWWTEGGSKRYLNDERSVAAAVRYVNDQDKPRA
jgi:REP element-mobilizing transposase RayT